MCLTTIFGGLCQTQLYNAVHNLFNVRSRIHWGPQNKNELCKTTTPGSSCPTLHEWCMGSSMFHTYFNTCETGPPAYSPYLRRLERLTSS